MLVKKSSERCCIDEKILTRSLWVTAGVIFEVITPEITRISIEATFTASIIRTIISILP